MAEAQQQTHHTPLKAYRGNCHCKAYVYEVKLPEVVESADECNCSLCYKKGALWRLPKNREDLSFVKGDPDTLADYTFGRGLFHHKFCPTCGVALMFVGHTHPPKDGEEKEPETGVNLRSLQPGQGIDVWKLAINPFDGASLPPPYQPPQFTGPEPKAEVEGGKLYTGSCHCGAVTIALRSKPLDKSFPERVAECNCSSCGRLGCVWTYPHKDQVAIEGEQNLATYTFNTGAWGKTFCRTCGVPVHNQIQPLTDEQVAGMSEEAKKWTVGAAHLKPVNLRLVHDLDVGDLKVDRMDGYGAAQPQYVEP